MFQRNRPVPPIPAAAMQNAPGSGSLGESTLESHRRHEGEIRAAQEDATMQKIFAVLCEAHQYRNDPETMARLTKWADAKRQQISELLGNLGLEGRRQ